MTSLPEDPDAEWEKMDLSQVGGAFTLGDSDFDRREAAQPDSKSQSQASALADEEDGGLVIPLSDDDDSDSFEDCGRSPKIQAKLELEISKLKSENALMKERYDAQIKELLEQRQQQTAQNMQNVSCDQETISALRSELATAKAQLEVLSERSSQQEAIIQELQQTKHSLTHLQIAEMQRSIHGEQSETTDRELHAAASHAFELISEMRPEKSQLLQTQGMAGDKLASLALDEMGQLLNYSQRTKVALEHFNPGEIAIFFPMPKRSSSAAKHFMAFSLKRCTTKHFLSEESKQLIGHSTHFREAYVLGRIVMKESRVSTPQDEADGLLRRNVPFQSVTVAPLGCE